MEPWTIVAGLGGGLCWAVLGYVKNKTNSAPEDFDIKKFVKSVIVGGVVGGYLAFTGTVVDVSTIEAFLASSALATPITGVAEKIASLIFGGVQKAIN